MTKVMMVDSGAGGGTWPPLAAVAEQLLAEGHTVQMVCDDQISRVISGLGVEVAKTPADVQLLQIIEEVIASDVMPKFEQGDALDDVDSPLELWADAVTPHVLPSVKKMNPDVVVGSMFGMPLASRLAKELRRPFVAINPGPYIGPNAPPRAIELDYPGLSYWWFTNNVLPPLLEADRVIHATDRQFDLGFDHLPSNHLYSGPIVWEPPGELPSEFSQPGDPWITASVSSIQQPGELDLIDVILEAASGLPARVLLTAPDHDHSALTTPPSNVVLTNFAPHGPALRQSALMLSHAGHGAVMRALWMGVPMVLTPWDRDQFAVAYRAEKLGVARAIAREELASDRLRKVLLSALNDVDLQKVAAKHSARLRRTNPRKTAADAILELALSA